MKDKTHYYTDKPPIWYSNQTDIDPETLFQQVTWTISGLFKSMRTRHLFADENGEFKFDGVANETNERLTEQRFSPFGRCYTWHPGENNYGIYYIKFRL